MERERRRKRVSQHFIEMTCQVFMENFHPLFSHDFRKTLWRYLFNRFILTIVSIPSITFCTCLHRHDYSMHLHTCILWQKLNKDLQIEDKKLRKLVVQYFFHVQMISSPIMKYDNNNNNILFLHPVYLIPPPLAIFFFIHGLEKTSTLTFYYGMKLKKGRDHRVTGALTFHKIRDFCILVMVLDVWT